MTKNDFKELTKNPLLLDGATGSNLMAAGMPRGVCTETWILKHRDILKELQQSYVNAGSRVLYAPTFGANRMNLSLHHLEEHIKEMNDALVSLARESAKDMAFVAGDVTTTGKMMEPAGDLTYETAFEVYKEQISYLSQAGVDFIIAETMINIEETLAAVDAASQVCDLPVLCSMTVEADGSIFSGGNAVEAALALESAGASAVGINCSVGPDQLVSVVRNIKEAVSLPVIAKPNAAEFAKHMKVLVENGASIIGGCCGTTPEYIKAVAEILKTNVL